MFGSFLTNGCVFTVYALNLYIASVGNVQNSSAFALLVSFLYCVAATVYQIPKAWVPTVYSWVTSHFSPVASSFILDADTPGLDEADIPGPLQVVPAVSRA